MTPQQREQREHDLARIDEAALLLSQVDLRRYRGDLRGQILGARQEALQAREQLTAVLRG